MLKPTSEIDLIRGIVTGTPFDMAVDGERIVGEATEKPAVSQDRRERGLTRAEVSLWACDAGWRRVAVTKPVPNLDDFGPRASEVDVFSI